MEIHRKSSFQSPFETGLSTMAEPVVEEENGVAEEVVEVKKLTKEEVDKALEERDVTVNDDGQYVDAQGVSRPHA